MPVDAPRPFTLFAGPANSGGALNGRVYLRLNAVFRFWVYALPWPGPPGTDADNPSLRGDRQPLADYDERKAARGRPVISPSVARGRRLERCLLIEEAPQEIGNHLGSDECVPVPGFEQFETQLLAQPAVVGQVKYDIYLLAELRTIHRIPVHRHTVLRETKGHRRVGVVIGNRHDLHGCAGFLNLFG